MPKRKRKGQRSANDSFESFVQPAAMDVWDYDDGPLLESRQTRKAKQICRQVFRTLDLVLSGECSDEYLGSLHVLSVDPAPDAARLMVTVKSDLPPEQFDRAAILEALSASRGRLRTEIAHALNRRKTPHLSFRVMGSPEEAAISVDRAIHPEDEELDVDVETN